MLQENFTERKLAKMSSIFTVFTVSDIIERLRETYIYASLTTTTLDTVVLNNKHLRLLQKVR